MTPMTFRRTLRWSHLATSAIIGTYLYSPWSTDPTFTAVTLYAVFPLMALTGVAMWQQARLARWLR